MAVLLFATTAMAQGNAMNVSVKKEAMTKLDSPKKLNKQNQKQSLRKAPISIVKKSNAKRSLKINNVRTNEQKQVRNMFAKQLAPMAPKTVYNVVATSFSSQYYAQDNDWYCVLENDEYGFAFDIIADEIEENVTYTLEDMLADYTTGVDYIAQAYITLVSAEFTYSINPTTGRAHIDATAVSDEGDTYNITYDQPEPQTIDVVCSEFAGQYYAADNDWYCGLMDEAGNEFLFDIILPAGSTFLVPGTYTLADMLEEYCEASYNGANLTYTTATFTYSVNSSDNTGHVVASVLASDGNTYNLTYDETPMPVDFDSVYVDMDEVVLNDFTSEMGVFQFVGNNLEYTCYLALAGNQVAGVYTWADVYNYGQNTVFRHNDIDVELGDAEVVITAGAAAGDYNCRAKLYSYDGTCYIVTMNYSEPVVADSVNIVATNLSYDDSYLPYFGVATLSASNAEYDLTFTIEGGDGSYTDPEVVLTDLSTGNTINIYSGELTVSNNQTLATGWLLGYNNVKYILDLSYVMPDPTRNETITVPAGELSDMVADMGAFQAMGYNAARDRYVSVVAYTSQIAGHYTMADADDYYTYVVDDPDDQALAVYYDLLDMDIDVTVNGSTATITGTLLCQSELDPTDVPLYTINMTCEVSVPGMQYDAEDEDFNENFSLAETQVDDSYFAQYGVIDLSADNANGATVAIEFFVDEEDADIIIPAGVYTIDDSEMSGTVIASPGVQGGYIYPSFAGYVDEEGYLSIPVWFMEAGTVTVAKVNGQLAVTVDATNSYGRSINITIGAGAGINDVNAAEVALYPNPATDKLNVVAEGVQTIDIIDAAGRVVMTRHQAGSIDVSALANGIYVVRTITNAGVNVQKIVKK